MKINVVIGLLLLTMGHAFAQECNETALLTTPGKWIEGMKGSTSGVLAADLAKERIIVDNLHKMMLQSYRPLGVDAHFNGAYYATRSDYQWVNQYSYNLRVLPYYCSGKAVTKAHETSTSLTIAANVITFGVDVYEPYTDASPWDNGFRSIRQLPVEKDGLYYYVEEASIGFGRMGQQHTWLITRDGQLPFLLVSKREFLERKKQKLLKGLEEEKAMASRNAESRENERKLMEKEYSNDPVKLQKYLKNEYEYFKAQDRENLARTEKNFLSAIAKVEALLKMPADELNKPAIVKQDSHDFLSHLFINATDPYPDILIKPNPNYFDKKLPRTSPQFISVVIVGNHKDPTMIQAMEGLQKAVDFAKLKGMLGK